MPIKKSAVKAMNRSQVLAKRNYDFKLRMKMAMKKFLKAVEAKEELTIEDLSKVFKAIDKAEKV
jgi:ribosomal protein S20